MVRDQAEMTGVIEEATSTQWQRRHATVREGHDQRCFRFQKHPPRFADDRARPRQMLKTERIWPHLELAGSERKPRVAVQILHAPFVEKNGFSASSRALTARLQTTRE